MMGEATGNGHWALGTGQWAESDKLSGRGRVILLLGGLSARHPCDRSRGIGLAPL